MRFTHFFIDRPIFATVLSVLIVIIGAIAQMRLPVAEYPEIAPPTVNVRAVYPGASAKVVAETVATPLEQEINGVDDMLYMSSQSTGDGALSINVVFKPGTNIDMAQVLVQNRVAVAEPRLPEDVRRVGVTVRKASPDLMMVVHMISPDGSRDQQYISNYATLNVKDVLTRVDGVGNVNVFGARDYSMRIWLDPDKLATRSLTANDVVTALRASNLQVAAGSRQPAACAVGRRLPIAGDDARPFDRRFAVRGYRRAGGARWGGDAAARRGAGGTGRTGLSRQCVPEQPVCDGHRHLPATGLERAFDSRSDQGHDGAAGGGFPAGCGLHDRLQSRPNSSARRSTAVVMTLFEAVALVVLVVILFLQTWRAAIIPIVAIPVSLIGTFAIMSAVGITFNTLSLFGLVLAIGIVVDDAIVVVENVERRLREGMSPKEAAHATMDEVGGAVIAISLVLIAVFVPTAFITGLQGAFYKQFGITIAAATAISAFVSLTLSPALAALLLKPHTETHGDVGIMAKIGAPVRAFFNGFNRMFERFSHGYAWLTGKLIRRTFVMLLLFAGLLGLTYERLVATPTGLIPQLDRTYFIVAFQLPPGSTLDRTDEVVRKASDLIRARPGIFATVQFVGLDGATFTNAPNAGVIFVRVNSFEDRIAAGLTKDGIINDIRKEMQKLREAFVLVIEPPSVPGIGTGGGIKGYVQDRSGRGLQALEMAAFTAMGAANQRPEFAQAFTLYNTRTPQIFADIDRVKAEQLGVPIANVFDTLSIYMGSSYVNDFNLLGRTFRVTAQADNPFRLTRARRAELEDAKCGRRHGAVGVRCDVPGHHRCLPCAAL